MDKTREIEFVFDLMCQQLREVAPKIESLFVALKNGEFLESFETLKEREISDLIKAFTLYALLLNIVDEHYYKSQKGRISQVIAELKEQKYDECDIQAVLRKIRFYPVFTARFWRAITRWIRTWSDGWIAEMKVQKSI